MRRVSVFLMGGSQSIRGNRHALTPPCNSQHTDKSTKYQNPLSFEIPIGGLYRVVQIKHPQITDSENIRPDKTPLEAKAFQGFFIGGDILTESGNYKTKYGS